MQSADADFKNAILTELQAKKDKLSHDICHGMTSRDTRDEQIGRVKGIDESMKMIEDYYKRLYSEQR